MNLLMFILLTIALRNADPLDLLTVPKQESNYLIMSLRVQLVGFGNTI